MRTDYHHRAKQAVISAPFIHNWRAIIPFQLTPILSAAHFCGTNSITHSLHEEWPLRACNTCLDFVRPISQSLGSFVLGSVSSRLGPPISLFLQAPSHVDLVALRWLLIEIIHSCIHNLNTRSFLLHTWSTILLHFLLQTFWWQTPNFHSHIQPPKSLPGNLPLK